MPLFLKGQLACTRKVLGLKFGIKRTKLGILCFCVFLFEAFKAKVFISLEAPANVFSRRLSHMEIGGTIEKIKVWGLCFEILLVIDL